MELLLVFFLVAVCFSIVLIFGAPYLPTQKNQSATALDLLDLKKSQILYELGCGDGTVLLCSAKRGITSVGYELNPILYFIAKIRCLRYGELISVKFGNFWQADLSPADGVYVFLLDRFMKKLDKKLSSELKTGVKLASYTFKIPGKKTIVEKSGIFIYRY